MPNIQISEPTTVAEFVEHVVKYQQDSKSQIWFRGTKHSSYKLLPGLYRHPKRKVNFVDLENQLINTFKHRSISFLNKNIADEWELLFFMQHYRLPTRLVDWTENPLIALYFAITENIFRPTSDAAVWMLNPELWNKQVLKDVSFKGGVLMPDDPRLAPYKPSTVGRGTETLPLAISGPHNSPRLIAQRGVFTIFGTAQNPMENILTGDNGHGSLRKILIRRKVRSHMKKQILALGFTESALFPDLEGIATELRRTFGFEV